MIVVYYITMYTLTPPPKEHTMIKGSKIRLINDSRIRAIEAQFHHPTSRLCTIVVGSVGVVVATRPKLDDHVLVKFPGYGSVLSLRGCNVEAV